MDERLTEDQQRIARMFDSVALCHEVKLRAEPIDGLQYTPSVRLTKRNAMRMIAVQGTALRHDGHRGYTYLRFA